MTEPSTEYRKRRVSSDLIGVSLSALCLLHCLAVPLLLALLPALAGAWAEQEWVHQLLIVFAFLAVGAAMQRGLMVHQRWAPLMLALVGLGFLSASLIAPEGHWTEKLVTAIGALATASAHLWNHSLTKRALTLFS